MRVLALALAILLVVGVVPTVGAAKIGKADSMPKAEHAYSYRIVASGTSINPYAATGMPAGLALEVNDGNGWTRNYANLFPELAAADFADALKWNLDIGGALGSLTLSTTNSDGATFTAASANSGVARVQVSFVRTNPSIPTASMSTVVASYDIYVNQMPVLKTSDGALNVQPGGSVQLVASPKVASDTSYIANSTMAYAVSGTAGASVDANGKITVPAAAAAGSTIVASATALHRGTSYLATASTITINVTSSAPTLVATMASLPNTAEADLLVKDGSSLLGFSIKTGSTAADYAAKSSTAKVEWTSGDETIVTLNNLKTVTTAADTSAAASITALYNVTAKALKAGVATITAKYIDAGKDYDGKTVTFVIKVVEFDTTPNANQNIFLLSSINVVPKVTIGGVDSTKAAAIVFTTSNDKVATVETVDGNCKVTGIAPGTAKITTNFNIYTTVGGQQKVLYAQKNFDVTVASNTGLLTVDPTTVTLLASEKATVTPTLTVGGQAQPAALVSWTSGDTKVATIVKNAFTGAVEITAVATGSTTVTASYELNGVKLSASAAVKVVDTKITFAKDFNRYTVKGGKLEGENAVMVNVTKAATSGTPSATVLTWTSSKPDVASITADPADPTKAVLAAGQKSGWTKITVKDTISGAEATSKYFYVISKYFQGAKSTLAVDETMTVTAKFYPAFLANGAWEVNNTERMEVVASTSSVSGTVMPSITLKCLKAGSVWLAFQSEKLEIARVSFNINPSPEAAE